LRRAGEVIDSLVSNKPVSNGVKNGCDDDDIFCTEENDEDVSPRSKRLLNGKSKRVFVDSSSSEEENDCYTRKGKNQRTKKAVEEPAKEEAVKKPAQNAEPVVNRQPQMLRYETTDSNKKGLFYFDMFQFEF
jgi:hypothetical protein